MYPLPNHSQITIKVHNSINNIKEDWNQAAPKDNLFLQADYLEMLEQHPPAKMSFKYVIFMKNNQAIGIAYHQVFRLSVEESLQTPIEVAPKDKSPACIVRAISNAVKKWFIKRADFNLLICGNLLLTGEYGFYFQSGYTKAQQAEIIQDSMQQVQSILDSENQKISIHLIKDHPQEVSQPIEDTLKNQNYHGFLMQPGMQMAIRPEWNTFDDYLASMTSKYRVRARRARKKGVAIVSKELTLEEIEANEQQIYTLYKEIAEGAGFNAFLLEESYFTALKRTLGDRYKLTAYYIDNQLVAFFTAIFNHNEMDAHFLGVDGNYNKEHQVYLNILYDLVNLGIEHKASHIDFARTALEIKSSVGAEAQDLMCFIKHRNTVSSKFINLIFDYINPKEEWQPRSPFKK
jgi:hypothetical protein